jgi:hypothetical protein
MLILSEGQADKTFEYSIKPCSFGNQGALERKLLSHLGCQTDRLSIAEHLVVGLSLQKVN